MSVGILLPGDTLETTMAAAAHLVTEALTALKELLSQPQPCVARASILLGVLQDRLFNSSSNTKVDWQLQVLLLRHQHAWQQCTLLLLLTATSVLL